MEQQEGSARSLGATPHGATAHSSIASSSSTPTERPAEEMAPSSNVPNSFLPSLAEHVLTVEDVLNIPDSMQEDPDEADMDRVWQLILDGA